MTYRNEQNTNILYKGIKIDTNHVSEAVIFVNSS
ncbi:hypothetical protein LES9216_00467 [Leuconostoc suionicum]|uniref:Uncharacterized protein n=1 Tax=Leuconostoc suionicum TaxID=1511761 RepID=A0A2N9K7M4_9LACO|nr:hypothetical protein LES8486_00320 [Leuconostoc suionicum]SPE06568.1 hypothetical protein LES9216_00467 [Leuconostoc suionicum]SPH03075.1 hypothetical protein LES8484_00320 [Leuconostoc suionicum]